MMKNLLLRDFLGRICLKVLNSALGIGLYYGFLTSFSIGPSYIFLIRARVMEKGSETEIAATTGFITGRAMLFLSIYYAPLHLALNRPHTVISLIAPYLFFHFLYKNNEHFYVSVWETDLTTGYRDPDWGSNLDSGYKNPNSICNFRIYKVFFNHLFLELLNPLFFPSSIVLRVMTIYLFRSNNKLLFLISSFVGWLIGHIFLMNCIGFVLFCLNQKNSIKSKIAMRFDKYTLLQLRDYVGQLFAVFAFFIFLRYLGGAPLPYLFFNEEVLEYDERYLEEIQAAIDADETNDEDITVYLSQNEQKENNINSYKKRKIVELEKSFVTTLFDYQRWSRPLRYIQNDKFDGGAVRDENSQFFFQTCESDGKKRISFSYPPHLATFRKMMEKKMDLFRRDKTSITDKELFNSWSSNIKEKENQIRKELFQRAKMLDRPNKKMKPVDVLDIRIRLADHKGNYLPKIYDPFLNGPARGESQKRVSRFLTNGRNSILVNKIHGLLISMNSDSPEFEEKIAQFDRRSNSPEFEQKIDQFDRKLLVTEIGFFFNLMKFSEKSISRLSFYGLQLFPEHEKIKSEETIRKRNFLLDAIRTTPSNDTIFNKKLYSEINEISHDVPRWSYQLVDDTEALVEGSLKDGQIRSHIADRLVIFTDIPANLKDETKEVVSEEDRGMDEYAIPNYTREPDAYRELIRGSVRPLRRKITISKLLASEGDLGSDLFLEIIYKFPFRTLFDDICLFLKKDATNPHTNNLEYLLWQQELEERMENFRRDEKFERLTKIAEDWESLLYGLQIRSLVILFQSMFRRYILLPSLIIAKNIIRLLLLQDGEWSEDFRDLRREKHIKCTFIGTPTMGNVLPQEWFWVGLQIRILYPFVLKPWHNKVRSIKKMSARDLEKTTLANNFKLLTGYGTLVNSLTDPTHFPNPFEFLGPILKMIIKQLNKDLMRKLENKKERKKESPILLEELKEVENELSEIQKNSSINIEESPDIIQSIYYSERRIKYLNGETKTILKQIEKMTEEKNEGGAKRLKKRFQMLQRRNVRLIRKSYCFFKIFMQRLYIHILTTNYVEGFLSSSIVQRSLDSIKFIRYLFELTNKIVKKSIYNQKKNEQRLDKTSQSIIPFMSGIEKPWNITDLNSENSCDVSSLSQAYVLFKLSESQVSSGYKLRYLFESHGRSFFLKNEIKDYFLRIQGRRLNSKLRDKTGPDSIMNQWTNWLKLHYQYALPERAWSRLVAKNWRNRIHEQRVAQNKDFVEYGSSQKILLKKQQVDLLELENGKQVNLVKLKKKIKKQYGYDLFSYQYINYVDKKKSSYIYGYKSPSYNTPKNIKELFDIMGDSFIQNYIGKDVDMDKGIDEKNMDRKYFHWMGMNGKKNSITNQKLLTPRFGFFSKVSAYKKNPWILPMNFFFLPAYENKNLSNVELERQKLENALHNDLQYYLKKYYSGRSLQTWYKTQMKYRRDLEGELNFLEEKYLSCYVYAKVSVLEAIVLNFDSLNLLIQMRNNREFVIISIKNGDLDLETLVRTTTKDIIYPEHRDNSELEEKLVICMEPIRISMKNLEQVFLFQILRISLKHKHKFSKRNSKKSRLDNYNYNLLLPEILLSPRRRREFRILMCLNSRNRKTVDRNTINEKKINNSSQVLTKNKDLDSDTKKLMNFKFFLWPNYRFEDLACMNRYWFDTHNGSRFSLLRIRMYPRLKI
uniref:Protein TIC 214 n=1 Tax=Vavilovia formosa TaxID=512756 RepID=A0A6G8QS55_9FABA|nr:hypothetical chloroplast RF19 [Vavilovia formosa]QIN90170.1 hypothetical chloroplast RF19 [Vavilovia formosa]